MATQSLFYRRLQRCGLLVVSLFFAGVALPRQQASSAIGQGFYFESWGRGPFGRPGGVSIDIGVQPSSPLFYGVRPSQVFPPLGLDYRFGAVAPALPLGYRDYRADYYDRLYLQYQAQLDAVSPYRVDPLHQSNIYSYLRSLSVPPLDGNPPVVAIEPFAVGGGHGDYAPHAAPSDSSTLAPADVAELLRDAAQRLEVALARRGEEGAIWRDYLAPDRIIQAVDEQLDPRELGTLLLNYDGVLANSDLRWVMRSDGFAQTRQLLRHYLRSIQPADGAEGDAFEAAEGNFEGAGGDGSQPGSADDTDGAYETYDGDTPPPPPSPSASPISAPARGATTRIGPARPNPSISAGNETRSDAREGRIEAELVPAPAAIPAPRGFPASNGIAL
jgi:hypothetical protein